MNNYYSELLILSSEAEYKNYYIREYCNKELYTHDGLRVKFRPERFEHAFYKSRSRRRKDKSIFSWERAERMNWIKDVLMDKSITIYAGWDSKKKRYDATRRVCLVTSDDYMVILRFTKPGKELQFVTAYLIDDQNVKNKVMGSPIVWNPQIENVDN